MPKKNLRNSTRIANNPDRPEQRFIKTKLMIVCPLIIIALLIAAFPWLYEIKAKAGIDISHKYHAGPFFEKHTRGLFKCEWLYPYHCDRPNT
jgi:hypothetical protein